MMLILETVDFGAQKLIHNKQSYYIMIKEKNVQEETATVNVYVPNRRTTKSVRQKLKQRKNKLVKPILQLKPLTPFSQRWTDPNAKHLSGHT